MTDFNIITDTSQNTNVNVTSINESINLQISSDIQSTNLKISSNDMNNIEVLSLTPDAQLLVVNSGAPGAKGADGATGPAGPGVATGGTLGQILAKNSTTDYDTVWTDQITQENIQDYVAPLFVHNNHINASVTYEDILNEIHIDVTNAPSAGYTSVVKHPVKLGEAINKGQAVYVSSSNGTNMIVSKASNAAESTSSKTMGILEASGNTNAFINVIAEGLLAGLDTSTALAGDPVWLGTSGNLIYGLVNKPYAPQHLVFIGIVTRVNQNNGEIFVKVQNGFELNEIHNVDNKSVALADGDLLQYESATSLWKNKPQSALTIAESQVTNLTTDLGLKAALTATQTFTGTQTLQSSSISTPALQVNAITSQTANTAMFNGVYGAFQINNAGLSIFGANTATALGAWINVTAKSATDKGIVVRGAVSQSVNLTEWQTSAGITQGYVSSGGNTITFPGIYANYEMTTTSGGSSVTPLKVKGAASQSANLTEWQDSTGAVKVYVNPSGDVSMGSLGLGFTTPYSAYGSTLLGISTVGAANKGMVVRGVASQTASLLELQDSTGAIKSRFTAGGSLLVSNSGSGWNSDSGYMNLIVTSAASIPLTLKGAASQTADYFQIQNSAGTPVVYVNQYAGLYAQYLTANWAMNAFSGSASTVPMTIKGFASQTANLTEWKDSTGFIRSQINPSGSFITYGGSYLEGTGRLFLNSSNAAYVPAVIRGAASQTGNLMEWQDSAGGVMNFMQSSGYLQIGSAGGVGGQLGINLQAAGNRGLVIRAASSQTANFIELQDSAMNIVARVNSAGAFAGTAFTSTAAGQAYMVTGSSNNAMRVQTNATTNVGLQVRGEASQTGDLTQWQDSTGTVISRIAGSGIAHISTNSVSENVLNVIQGSSAAAAHIFSTGAGYLGWVGTRANGSRRYAFESNPTTDTGANFGLYEYDATGSNVKTIFNSSYSGGLSSSKITLVPVSATSTPFVVRGVASQTVSLTEWQDSTGAVKAFIDSAGNFRGNTGSMYITTYNILDWNGTNYGTRIRSTYSAATVALTVQGQASQTANLQEWQNSSGTVFSKIDSLGNVSAPNIVSTYIQNTPPESPSVKYMWWDTSNGDLTLWIEDGT